MCTGDLKFKPTLPKGDQLKPWKSAHYKWAADQTVDPGNVRSMFKTPEPLPLPEAPKALAPVKFAQRRGFNPERTAGSTTRRTSLLTG